jgi:hypothetical protein
MVAGDGKKVRQPGLATTKIPLAKISCQSSCKEQRNETHFI